VLIVTFIAAIAARIFFALARSALINMRRPRLLELEQKGVASARHIQQLTDNSGRFLATAEVGALISLVFAAGVASLYLTPLTAAQLDALLPDIVPSEWTSTMAFAMVVFVTALVLFVLGRLVPEAIAVRYTEPLALGLVRPMQVVSVVLAPLVRFAVVLSNWLSIPFGGQKRESATLVTEQELKTMVDAGEEEGLIEIEEKEMILSVLDFGDTVAREVMVPRIDIVAIDVDTRFDEALLEVVKAGHSRIPVYRDSIDEIQGVLYAKDMLRALADNSKPTIGSMLRPVTFMPESKKVNELLQELQKTRVHMCIVVDEFGGTAGLVTIEDILEEIVGEIQDEFDTEEPDSVPLPNGMGYVLDAGMNLDDVNELLKVNLMNESSDTLGGYIYDHLGKVPVPGDSVRQAGLNMEVLGVRDRRILKVKVTYAPSEDGQTDQHVEVNEAPRDAEGRASQTPTPA
jgi:putative hemolysin